MSQVSSCGQGMQSNPAFKKGFEKGLEAAAGAASGGQGVQPPQNNQAITAAKPPENTVGLAGQPPRNNSFIG